MAIFVLMGLSITKTDAMTTIEELNRLVARFEKELSNNQAYIGLRHAKGLLSILEASNHHVDNPIVMSTVPIYTPDGYNVNASQIQKAEFVLKEANKALTTAEIVEKIIQLEPSKDKRKTAAGLSAVLGDYAKRNKVVTRYKNKNGELVYSLIEWPHDPTYH